MFALKSSWEPPDSYLPKDIRSELDKLDVLLNKIQVLRIFPISQTWNSWKALFKLRHRDDIVFKKAATGSAIAILDKDDYIL